LPRDKQLRDLCESFVKESLELLRAQLAAGGGIGKRVVLQRKVIWQDTPGSTGTSLQTNLVLKLLTGSFIFERIDSLEKLTSANRLLEYAESDETVRKHYDHLVSHEGKPVRGSQLQNWIGRDLFLTFFRRYVGEPPDFSFDIARFEREYSEMEDYLYGRFVYTYFAPVACLNLEGGSVELVSGLTIRRINQEEINLIFGDDLGFLSSPVRDFTLFKDVIECRVEQSRFGELTGRIESVITALRLLKQSGVGISSIIQEPPQLVYGFGMMSQTWPGTMTHNILAGYCILSAEEVNIFKEFHTKFLGLREHISKMEYISLALRRYNSALDETQFDDKIIDFMIALEALFSSDARELRYRLSLRVASFLGEDDKEKEEILEFMKKAYDARSEIVHGGIFKPFRLDGKLYDVNQTSHRLGEVTRLSLLKSIEYIARPEFANHDAFLDLLDKSLISNGAKEELQKGAADEPTRAIGAS